MNWAAIEAWSLPGSQSVGRPVIRAWRVMASSTVVRWAWPRWSAPVMLGGGWMITKGGFDQSARLAAPSGAKPWGARQRREVTAPGGAAAAPRGLAALTRGLCRPSGALLLSVPAVRRGV